MASLRHSATELERVAAFHPCEIGHRAWLLGVVDVGVDRAHVEHAAQVCA